MNDIIHAPPEPALQQQWDLTRARYETWVHTELFTLRWWLLLALLAVTAWIWWIKADKKRLTELSLYTSIIIIFIIVLDELGDELSLWYYPVDLLFIFPPTTAINVSSMPLIYMLIYQRFKAWPGFVAVTAVMALVFCFVFEPIAIWAGIYQPLTWKSYYGFPIYMAIALLAKLAVGFVLSLPGRMKQRCGQ